MIVCRIEECNKKRHQRSTLCAMHRWRKYNHGAAEAPVNDWRKDNLTYYGAHARLRRELGPASVYVCSCGEPAQEWAFDEPHGHSSDITRYTPLCTPCHKRKDAA